MITHRFKIAVREARQRCYDALRSHDAELYRRTILGAQGVILNHRLEGKAAVDCEAACVLAVCDALKLGGKQ